MTTIILDQEAIKAIFPEGTEARVELQRTVLDQLAKQVIREPQLNDAILKKIDSVRNEVMKAALDKVGVVHGLYGRVTLNKEAESRVRTAAEAAVYEIVSEAVKSVEIKAIVDAQIEGQVSIIVRKALAEVVKANETLKALNSIMKGGA